MNNKNNLAYIFLFLTVLFWAGNFIVGKFASYYGIPPFSLNFYRWLFAWLILAPFTIPEIIAKKKYIKDNFKLFLILGITSITVFNSIILFFKFYTGDQRCFNDINYTCNDYAFLFFFKN